MKTKTLLRSGLAALALALPATASAADNPYEKGPAPTVSNLRATSGTYGFDKYTVPDSATGAFGAATIWAPKTTTGETFAALSVAPGFTESETAIRWVGQRLVQRGFVVITFNTNSIIDAPNVRGKQLLAALDYLSSANSPVKNLVDPTREGVVGHSMGGGGTLEAAKVRPSLKAAIALTPWDLTTNWSTNTTPTLIVAAQNDIVAPKQSHAIPFYKSLPATTPKYYLEAKGADHFITNKASATVQSVMISFAKRFLDDDTRFTNSMCPFPIAITSGTVSLIQNNCDVY